MATPDPYAASNEGSLAVDGWTFITEKPSSVVLRRGNANLAAQTVRIEYDTTSNNDVKGAAGQSAKQQVIVFGVEGHPTIADTNIARSDRFAYRGQQFTIISVIFQTGQIQANAEALS